MLKYKRLIPTFRQSVLYAKIDTLRNCNQGSKIEELYKTSKASKMVLALICN